MNSDEQILYELLKAGDEKAYGILYRNHYAILCHFANFYLHDRFSAESVVEDVIYHLWENRESLNITKSIRSYLVMAVRNKCLDTLKLKRNQNEKPISSLSDKAGYYMDSQTAGDSPYGTLLSKELEEKVIQAIEALPAECRQVFLKAGWKQEKQGNCRRIRHFCQYSKVSSQECTQDIARETGALSYSFILIFVNELKKIFFSLHFFTTTSSISKTYQEYEQNTI